MIVDAFVELAVIVVLLYVSELVVYLPPGRIGLMLRGKRARLVRGLGLKSPWPWSAFYALDDFHLQLGIKGAFAYSPHRVDSRKPLGYGRAYIDYADLGKVSTSDEWVLTSGKPFVKCVSVKAARRMQRELEDIQRLPEAKRGQHIKKLISARIDPGAAAHIRAEDDACLSGVRLVSTMHMVVVTTLLIMCVFGRIEHWPAMLGMLVLSLVTVNVQFFFAYKKLWPSERLSLWNRLFISFVTPLPAMKAADFTTRDRLADVHMFAAMRAFMKPATVGPILRLALRDALHPGSTTWTDPDPKARAAQEEHRAILAQVLEEIAPPEEATAPADDEGIVVRCPRCGSGYTRAVDTCHDCGATITVSA